MTGSNRRPSACKADALPTELTALNVVHGTCGLSGQATRQKVLDRLRGICLALPETTERLSHGAPSFFVREKKCFLMLLDDHHGDGRFAIWCAAPPGNQELLIAANAERFFRPPYVGHRGWLGVSLERRRRLGRARGNRRGRLRLGRPEGACCRFLVADEEHERAVEQARAGRLFARDGGELPRHLAGSGLGP